MALTTNYMATDENGRVKGISPGQFTTQELTSGAASFTQDYIVGIDDKWIDHPHSLSHNTIKTYEGTAWDYQAEWYLLCDAGNGYSFEVGEVVTQVMPGTDVTGECVGFEQIDPYRFSWKKNEDVTTTALLTIKNVGPTGGTGGPTGPVGGTGGTGSGGPSGPQGGTMPKAIVGVSYGAYWNVIGVSRRINVNSMGNIMKNYELDALGGACYAHIQYAQGVCLDMFESITELGDLFEQVKLNHDIYGTADGNSTMTVTVYDRNHVPYTINAVSGGTPDETNNSQLRTLYHNWLAAGDADGASRDLIEAAYSGVGGACMDSIYKLRTYFEGRNS